jgi:hypothetical protein
VSIAKLSTQKEFKLPHADALIKYTLSFIELSQMEPVVAPFLTNPT